jgi:hypothetical protein
MALHPEWNGFRINLLFSEAVLRVFVITCAERMGLEWGSPVSLLYKTEAMQDLRYELL